MYHRGLIRSAVRTGLVEQFVDGVRNRIAPHPLDGVRGAVVAEAAPDLPEMGDVPLWALTKTTRSIPR